MQLSILPLPLLLAFMAALVLTPILRRVAIRFGYVAKPRADRWHSRPTALLGGAAVALPTLIGAVALTSVTSIWPILLTVTLLFGVGLVDDLRSLKPSTKLVAQIAAASLLVYQGFGLHWTSSLTLDALLTIFWIVGITNAFNLLDNMDGLCAGVAVIAGAALATSLQPGTPEATYLWLLLGATAGFLVFNFNPASIFLGDGGSLFIGASVAALALRLGDDGGTTQNIVSVVAAPVFALLIPILDTTLVTASRLWHGRSPAVGGRDHSSHRLVAIGLSERAAVGVLWMLAALGGGMAAGLRYVSADWSWPTAVLLLAAMAIFAAYLAQVKVYDSVDPTVIRRARFTRIIADFVYKRRVAEVLLDVCLISSAYYFAHRLRFEGTQWTLQFPYLLQSLPIVVAVQTISLFVVGAYRGIWRYFSLADVVVFGKGVGVGVLGIIAILVFLSRFESYSRVVFPIYAALLMLLLVGSRASFRLISESVRRRRRIGERLVVYGASEAGMSVVRALVAAAESGYRMIGFVDEDASTHGTHILGYRVLGGYDRLTTMIVRHDVDTVIVSSRLMDALRLAGVQQLCAAHGVKLFRFHIELQTLAEGGPGAAHESTAEPRARAQ
jgi:UDP-GlcNAc:undecaprenyl-phosphate GlcNAc-1-phosphate transferase